MFKANNVLLPPALQKYFVKSSDVHSYNTRNSRNFHTPQVSSKLKSMAISSVGVSIWNYLSKHLNCINASPLSKFRKECKHFFISNYESNQINSVITLCKLGSSRRIVLSSLQTFPFLYISNYESKQIQIQCKYLELVLVRLAIQVLVEANILLSGLCGCE